MDIAKMLLADDMTYHFFAYAFSTQENICGFKYFFFNNNKYTKR